MPLNEKTTTLVFDWGGTLMLEDKHYSGIMADWPEVKAVPGIYAGLNSLGGKFRLAVASNASDSDAAQLRRALERVELDSFFDEIFTFHELKARKPDLLFFRGVEEALGLSPNQLLMIGDDFWADACGARQAGWQAIWYNPKMQACPGLNPFHQAEVASMPDLPAALELTSLPDPQTCYLWCLEQGFSYQMWQHVQLVAALAYQLAAWLREKGQSVNPILAHRGGLLHDVAKITARQIQTRANHAEVAGSLLNERQQPALAEIARRHIIYAILDAKTAPRTWEEKLVYFADKLAEGGQLVDVEKRLEGLEKRHPAEATLIEQVRQPVLALKEEIANAAGKKPAGLVRLLTEALKGNGE
jgi:putative hydrolase of the HAD superfamily